MVERSLLQWAKQQPGWLFLHSTLPSPQSISAGHSLQEGPNLHQQLPVCKAVTQAAWQAEHSSLPTVCCSRICLCLQLLCAFAMGIQAEAPSVPSEKQPRRTARQAQGCRGHEPLETGPLERRAAFPASAVPPPHPASSPPLGVQNASRGL